ncbi:hypothetical protein [Halorubrum tropicale]|uniref:hypothetical protein n=1 Tax=Halorubrum tropicale TaxID=1765655 RepID=UPI001111DBCD|nr:hypothetical protein [Halorubrum tropicale]
MADRSYLSDFGIGLSEEDIGPSEEDVGHSEENLSERELQLQELSRWLSATRGVKVFSRSKKNYTHGKFSAKSKYQPDLLVCDNSNSYLVKFTPGDNGSLVYDTIPRIIDYWRGLASGDDIYLLNNSNISIDAVLIATNYSEFGHLFHNRQNNDPLRTGRSEGARRAASKGYLPEIEHSCSESILRVAWRLAKRHEYDTEVGIGALYSSRLDSNPTVGNDPEHSQDGADYTPAALYSIPGKTKSQQWEYLPFHVKNSS